MFPQLLNWRTGLAAIAIAIVTGTVFYSNYLSKKIAADERKKVNVWVQSLKTRVNATEQSALDLTNIITSENTEIPIIGTDEKDNPLNEFLNIDSAKVKTDSNYLKGKVKEFKRQHDAITVEISKDPLVYNKYYYGDSDLLKQVRYYPIIQLFIWPYLSLLLYWLYLPEINQRKTRYGQVWQKKLLINWAHHCLLYRVGWKC